MQKLDRVYFLVLLIEAVERFEALAEASKTPFQAAKIAIDLHLAPKSGVGVLDNIVQTIVFFGDAKKYYKDISPGILNLMARLQEERAWASYQRHLAQQAA